MENHKAVGFECRKMSNILGRCVRSEMAKAGFDEVAITHGWILGYLYDHRDEVIYQRDLEERFGLARSSVANIVKLMEQRGYITRETEASDARYKKVKLTAKGEELQLDTVRLLDSFNEHIEQGITPQERECFNSVMSKLKDNIQTLHTMEEQ